MDTPLNAQGAPRPEPRTDPRSVDDVRMALQQALGARYEIGNLMTPGRTGCVVRARLQGDGPVVALKAVSERRPDLVARITNEVTAARLLRHPSAVPVLDEGRLGGYAYYTTPFFDGGSAEDLIRKAAPLPLDRVVSILTSVADALDDAHGHGVVHGALSPRKILFDAAGAPHIVDFASTDGRPPLEHADPAYSAPEHGDRMLWSGGAADQFALAIIAYEMLTGIRRVSDTALHGIPVLNPVEVTPDRPLRPGVTVAAGAAIHRALVRNPAARFATVGEFVRTMALPDAKVHADSLPTMHPHREYRRRSSIVPLLVVALIASGLAALAFETSGRDDAPLNRAAEDARNWVAQLFDIAPARGGPPTADDRTPPVPLPQIRIRPRPGGPVTASGGNAASRPRATPPGRGVVSVTASAGGVVVVDGVPRGSAPFVGTLDAGTHRVSIVNPTQSYDSPQRDIVVAGGDTATVSFGTRTAGGP